MGGPVSSSAISAVFGWEALDSRGSPTVGCEVRLAGGALGAATVPSGASVGSHEAHELRDGGTRYGGRGVRRAVANVCGPLAEAVRGLDALDQEAVDRALRATDGSADLSRLGANATLAVSVATALAGAAAAGRPLYEPADPGEHPEPVLPMPMVNILSGGAHAASAIDLQDVLMVPVGAETFAQAIEWAVLVRRSTAAAAEALGLGSALVADEGGLGLELPTNRRGLELVVEGVERSGLALGDQVALAIDVAANRLYDATRNVYVLAREGRTLTAGEWVEELVAWTREHPIVSIEDPLAEDDWDGWMAASAMLPPLQLLGDDLFVTDLERLERGIALGVANAVLVKPNQAGTLSDARAVVERAGQAGYVPVISARSGETEDSWLADLCVRWRVGQVKVGSTMRSERTAKWNRLLRIEAEAGSAATFSGRAALAR